MTIFTSRKGLCGYDRDDMSCQDFCTVCLMRTFPSHYSICKQHVIPAGQHLHVVFSFFLIFVDDFTNWEYYCESAIIFCGLQTPPVPFNRSLPVHEPWCIYQNNIWFLKIVVNGFQVAGKAQLYISFYCTYIHLQAMQNPGKLIDEEGHQFHVSADTCTCKPVVKKISSQYHTPCQWVFGTTFTGTTFLETGACKLVW